jgi:hypothetical protein
VTKELDGQELSNQRQSAPCVAMTCPPKVCVTVVTVHLVPAFFPTK